MAGETPAATTSRIDPARPGSTRSWLRRGFTEAECRLYELDPCRGLSETELLDALGVDGEKLPGALWSPLRVAADRALVERSGLLPGVSSRLPGIGRPGSAHPGGGDDSRREHRPWPRTDLNSQVVLRRTRMGRGWPSRS